MSTFPQAGLDRLAERVAAGEVVFFIGSGFSVDSEGNDTYCLVCRLLVRFDALTRILKNLKFTQCTEIVDRALELRKGLRETFSLVESKGGLLATSTQIKALAREYYTFNDWITSAFSLLLGEIGKLYDQKPLLERLYQEERTLLAKLAASSQEQLVRLPRLSTEDLNTLISLPASDRGKALFLETMGFADPDVMAGNPHDPNPAKARESYGDRLLPRHRVLAWLAREGFAPILLTTNFDLLLEGAYRVAGLVPRTPRGIEPPSGSLHQVQETPPATFDSFCRIASATQFFGRGDDRRSAHLLKIHGCAEIYRWARRKGADSLVAYLRALVFTFREIQNWREDSWSRDLVSTLLRTRSIVFCGYSTADPVLHDTIRTVYEEMARRRGHETQELKALEIEAPAFFLGGMGKTEFYGMEILRAASRAVGSDPGLTEHPNYLRFHFVSKHEPARFPTLDEMMRWLFHLTFRRRQVQALESDLGIVATVLLGHPCPESERQVVLEQLGEVLRAEKAKAEAWNDQPGDRISFERIVGWTERFQTSLLREYALADRALRASGPGLEIERIRHSPWYYPALDHTDWAAWGAVIELALRRRISAWQGVTQCWAEDRPWLSTAVGTHPSVLYAKGASRPTPSSLTIRLRTPHRHSLVPAVQGAYRQHFVWELDYGEIPWRRVASTVRKGGPPDAAAIWKWSHKPLDQLKGEILDWLV